MDGSTFDTLARLAATAGRRRLLRSGLALLGAGLGLTALLATEEGEAAKSCEKKCKQKAKKKDWSRKKKKACLKRCQEQDPSRDQSPVLQACVDAAECGNDTDGVTPCACRDHESGQRFCSKNGSGDVRFFPAGTSCGVCQGGEQCFLVNGGAGGIECILPCRA